MSANKFSSRKPFRAGAVFLLGLGMLVTLPIASAAAEEDEAAVIDGSSEEVAAASCWEIKQNDPGAQDGVYWLWTPQLGAPEQFYCDQSTDGGGWVLIGRGREGWSESNNGFGTPAQVRSPITGQQAFAPRQLSSATIEALLAGEPVSSLPDGIRLRRAVNTSGTQWQELTFNISSPRDTWTWQFYNNQRVGSWTVDGVARSGGTTTNFGMDNVYRRVTTTSAAAQGWQNGFGFGTSARGNPASSSYIWGNSTAMINPRPFTQVFLRPKVTSADTYTELGEEGLDAIPLEAGANSFAEPTVWGVSGLGNGPNSVEGSNEVSAFTEVDGKVFVGGNFTRVEKSRAGNSRVNQEYLAAFDVDSGEWISTFRPTFNRQVKALTALPNNRIAVGGYFTEVNGQERNGLAVLDATTGELDPNFSGELINYLSGGSNPIVRGLDAHDGWLYIGGNFTHATGGTESREAYMRAGARISVVDGTPDYGWNPEFNGTVIAVSASERGDRAYFAGYFGKSQESDARRGAAIRTSDASALEWYIPLSSTERAGYQQAVLEVGDRIWLGGSEHNLYSYDRDNFQLLSTIIGQRGGDFQAIAATEDRVYGGCHCFDAMYSGATSWPNIGNSWTSADRIYATGEWDAHTGDFRPSFSPEMYNRAGAGAWALFVDSRGVLWQGGDFTDSWRAGYVQQWSAGFVRHAPISTTVPDKPKNLATVSYENEVSLTWNAVAGAQSYEVLNSGRVVATSTSPSVNVPRVSSDNVFAVRAVDAAGNRSQTSTPVTADDFEPGPQDSTLIQTGATWSYMFDADAPDGDWNDWDSDDSTWQTGSAPLGWGTSDIATELSTSATPKPLASYYRHTLDVVDASAVEAVLLNVRVDDGTVVYVNGHEVFRQNIDPGSVTHGTYANRAVSAQNAMNQPSTVEVPGNYFRTGTNVIAAEVHSNYRATPSHSFELDATAIFGVQPDPEPDPDPDPDPPVVGELIGLGSDWAYFYSDAAVDSDWADPSGDVSGWDSGAAPLGWGVSGLGTQLTSEASLKPLTSYYRGEFEIGEDAEGGVVFTTRADDGIVIYLNGEEVFRQNIDPGPVTQGTYANRAVSASVAQTNPTEFTVAIADLEVGTNVIAAEVHSNYRATPSHSFELEAHHDANL